MAAVHHPTSLAEIFDFTTISHVSPPTGYTPTALESWWISLFDGRNRLLTLTSVIFIMHELVYFGRFLPFWLCDFVPAFQKYKIQPNKVNSAPLLKKALKGVLFSHFFVQLPMMLLFDPVAELFGMQVTDVPFPTWGKTARHLAVFFVFEDFYHYCAHRALHWGPLYKNIHKMHHEYSAPSGLAAEYAHPLETMILGFGTIGGPVLWTMATGDLHVITMLTWMVFRMIQAIDSHSGYDFPWSLRHWFPLWSGAEFHDYHHEAFVNNYATSFRFWDWLLGTDLKYKAHRARQQAAKAAAHSDKRSTSKEE